VVHERSEYRRRRCVGGGGHEGDSRYQNGSRWRCHHCCTEAIDVLRSGCAAYVSSKYPVGVRMIEPAERSIADRRSVNSWAPKLRKGDGAAIPISEWIAEPKGRASNFYCRVSYHMTHPAYRFRIARNLFLLLINFSSLQIRNVIITTCHHFLPYASRKA